MTLIHFRKKKNFYTIHNDDRCINKTKTVVYQIYKWYFTNSILVRKLKKMLLNCDSHHFENFCIL